MNVTLSDSRLNHSAWNASSDNSGDYIELEGTLQLTRFVVQRIIVPLIVSVGVVGNVISMIILSRPAMASSTNCYLFGLAIADVMYLLCSFTLSFKHYPTIDALDSYRIWYAYGKVFSDLFANASVWFTVSFTIERYVAVRYPVRGRLVCTRHRAKIVLAIVAMTTTLLTFPEFFESSVTYITINDIQRVEIVNSEMSNSVAYTKGYYWFFIMSFTIIPLVALATLNAILVISVYSAQKMRTSISCANQICAPGRRHSEQQRITILLIVMVVVFIVCQTPYAFLLIYMTHTEITRQRTVSLRIAANFANLLIQINAAVNIFLYVAFSTRFRQTFSRMFCRDSSNKRRYSFDQTYVMSSRVQYLPARHALLSNSRSVCTTSHGNCFHAEALRRSRDSAEYSLNNPKISCRCSCWLKTPRDTSPSDDGTNNRFAPRNVSAKFDFLKIPLQSKQTRFLPFEVEKVN